MLVDASVGRNKTLSEPKLTAEPIIKLCSCGLLV